MKKLFLTIALIASFAFSAGDSTTICTGTKGNALVKLITVDNKFYIVHYKDNKFISSDETTNVTTPEQFNIWCRSLGYISGC